jgi:hypothetical protein
MRTLSLSFSILVACSVFSPSLSALDCRVSGRPAATLLFPYFEVDLADPAGATTLISIANVGAEPTLANVVLWTDCSFPALSFPVYLPGDGVQTLNLRAVLAGQLPVTGPGGGESFPGCMDPLELPTLDGATLSTLRAWLAGDPDPGDGLCYGTPRPGSQLAVGSITVDVLAACSDSIRTPMDEGYFEAGGTGLASNDNVLRGDFFLVDPGGNAAQGAAAVSVVADAAFFAANPFESSFYLNYGPEPFHPTGDDRYPLGNRYRTRYLDGGGFDGGTDLILWFGKSSFPESVPPICDGVCHGAGYVHVFERDEAGELLDLDFIAIPGNASRWTVGVPPFSVDVPFGTIELRFLENCGLCSPPFSVVGSWAMPTYTAEGRFSAGLPAQQLINPCE